MSRGFTNLSNFKFRRILSILLCRWEKKTSYEEVHGLYFSPKIVRVIKSRSMRWAGHVKRMGRVEIYRVLVGKPEGNRPLRRLRRR
jgi:hypothetical protein